MPVILPPNSTVSEKALALAMRADIDFSKVPTLLDPASCPADVLPFLAWHLAISHWDPAWSEAQKRAAIADAIPFHFRKGTRASVEEVLARFSPLLHIVEWFERSPAGEPYTFEVRAPMDFLTVETTEAIIRDVAAAKPLRSHFDFVQIVQLVASVYLVSGATVGTMHRADYSAVHDTTTDYSLVLMTGDGEPILDGDGSFLEIA